MEAVLQGRRSTRFSAMPAVKRGEPAEAVEATLPRRIETKTIGYLWQLPQNLLGLAFLLIMRGRVVARRRSGEQAVFACFRTHGGISLGRYVFVHREADDYLVRHELGHCRQSRLLGPLYLPVIGLPSMGWATLYAVLRHRWPHLDYFRFYTESWANRLAGLGTEVEPRADADRQGDG